MSEEDDSDRPAAYDRAQLWILNDLSAAHKYTRQNPTFRNKWGGIDRWHSDWPMLADGSEMNVSGEREFWFNYGKYLGAYLVLIEIASAEDVDLPVYVDAVRELIEQEVDWENYPVP